MYRETGRKNKVMVFGVFDGPHEGHRWFLGEAAKQGNELIVVVARDEIVRLLKEKNPMHNEVERLRSLGDIPEVSRAVLGDLETGSYEVLKKHQPDVICLGYDQQALAEDLKKRIATGEIPAIRLVRLKPHEPERWHTSLLTRTNK